MAKKRKQKESEIDRLDQNIRKSKAVVISSQAEVNVKDIESLRRMLRQNNAELQVIKKTLLQLIVNKHKLDFSSMTLEGTIGLAYSFSDEVAAPKIIYNFCRDHEGMKIIGGLLDTKILSREEVLELAKLPSRQDLLSTLVFIINSPIRGLVNVLNGNIRKFVTVLGAIRDEKNNV